MNGERLVVIGSTGSGKSSLCNILSGQDSSAGDFPVSEKLSAGTFATTCRRVKWLGYGLDLTIIDTPGLDDPQGKDSEHIAEMVETLKQIQHVNMFLVVFNAQRPRMDSSLAAMFRIFQGMFGSGFWRNTVILFSRWAFDSRSEKLRQKENVTADSHGRMVNSFFREQLGVTTTIPCVYVDSCYQEDEERELQAFRRETKKLLDILHCLPRYECKDFEKVLSEMDELQKRKDAAEQEKAIAEAGLQQATVEKYEAIKDAAAAKDNQRKAEETLLCEKENFARSQQEADRKLARVEDERIRCQQEAVRTKAEAERAQRRFQEEQAESKRKAEEAELKMQQVFETEKQKLEMQAKLREEEMERHEREAKLQLQAQEAEHKAELAQRDLKEAEKNKENEENEASKWGWLEPVSKIIGGLAAGYVQAESLTGKKMF